jgi:hypothetical protein
MQEVFSAFSKQVGSVAVIAQVNSLLAQLRACRTECGFFFQTWRFLAHVEATISIDRDEALLLLKTLGCESAECEKTLDSMTQSSAVTVRAATSRTTVLATFLERNVMIGGIALCCAVLLALVGVVVTGLALRQFAERLVWLVFLFGAAAANIALLALWASSFPVVDSSAASDFPYGSITFSIGLVVRLVFAVLLLMLLFLFLSTGNSKKLAVAFTVFGVLLSLAVPGVVVTLFAVPGWSSVYSESFRQPFSAAIFLEPRLMMWSSALIVSAISLLMAGVLCVLMIRAFRAADSVHKADVLRRNALLRNVVLCGLMTLVLAGQVTLSAMDCPSCPFVSQMLFVFGGFMLPIALLSLLVLGMVLNSWATSYWIQHNSESLDMAMQAKLLAQPLNRMSGTPSRYEDY